MHLTSKSGRKIELPTDEEDTIITQQAKEDDTHWTDEQLDQFKPIDQIPEMKDFVKSRGRPQAEVTKDKVTIRLSPEVTEYFRNTGKGWQSKIDKILVDYVSDHNLKG